MSLKDNISKHVTSKIVDLILVLTFLAGLLFIVSFQSKYTIIYIVLVIVVYFLLGKYINKRFDNWKVQAMTIEEQKKFNNRESLLDIVLYLGFLTLIYFVGKDAFYVFSILFLIIFLYNENKKRKDLKKREAQENPVPPEETVPDEEPKEAEIVEEENKVE